jgi:glycosyltransferase involved in cell wall biosynthesis
MQAPLVTVICLCYNHELFVQEAIQSVLSQSYNNIEIIIIDDASNDRSKEILQSLVAENPRLQFFSLRENVGNCTAFNHGLKHAHGEFIIDFATDDIMLPEKIRNQVNFFLNLDKSFGVVFTDALYINKDGIVIRKHYDYLFREGFLKKIPEGDVYSDVLGTYFIASPTQMIRKEVLDELHGYDEDLAYEDFDFWVRSSRKFKYAYMNEVTIKIRRSNQSMSANAYKRGDKQLMSTYLVCKKAMDLNRNENDKKALRKRLKFEIRQSVFSQNHDEARLFYNLLKEIDSADLFSAVLMAINAFRLPLSFFRNLYHQIRYR